MNLKAQSSLHTFSLDDFTWSQGFIYHPHSGDSQPNTSTKPFSMQTSTFALLFLQISTQLAPYSGLSWNVTSFWLLHSNGPIPTLSPNLVLPGIITTQNQIVHLLVYCPSLLPTPSHEFREFWFTVLFQSLRQCWAHWKLSLNTCWMNWHRPGT